MMRHLCRVADLLRSVIWIVVVVLMLPRTTFAESFLSPRNLESPFPYLAGGVREWPILEQAVPRETQFELSVRDGETILNPEQVAERGLQVAITKTGLLGVTANKEATARLHVRVVIRPPGGAEEQQTLEIRPAPPDRPISYYADFGDDLIRIFMNSTSGQFSPVTKSGFDQYFRRLQAHGTRRLIVWLSPFPFIADSANYAPDDWQVYERQARAILDDESLTQTLNGRTGFATWSWLRYLLATRLNPEFGPMLGQSAAEHGIKLTVCYRPFEAALTKYYEVPAFDQDGNYLGGFLPLASPTVQSRPDQVGWRHYRDVLRDVGHADAAELAAIEFPGVTEPERFAGKPGIELVASPYPPQSDEAFVLIREPSGQFRLRPFATLRESADSRRTRIDGVKVEAIPGGLRVSGVTFPRGFKKGSGTVAGTAQRVLGTTVPDPFLNRGCRYLIVSWTGAGDGPDLSALSPVVLQAMAGNRLGRETTYFVQGGPADPSRVAGVTANGEYWAEFQASEASQRAAAAGPERVTLAGRQLVIDVGDEATVEMIDFNQPLARQNAVREIATVLRLPGFDDVLLNTRSHVDLPVSMADGDQGTRPVGKYWHERRGPGIHLGLDKAYLPRSAASLKLVRELADQPNGIEQITTWQPDEWRGECQTLNGPRWRFARNCGTADGLRLLLEDFERAFLGRRIRMLIPPGEAAVHKVWSGLDALQQPNGSPYRRDFYYQLWPSNNHIPAVGEGAALVDLRGLSVEPAFLGSGGYLPGLKPVELYVRECVADLADNRGSKIRGPRSYFFEAQTTLRSSDPAARKGREEMICHLLSQRTDINEVILYEAADWLYFLPLSDTGLCGHDFLNHCHEQSKEP